MSMKIPSQLHQRLAGQALSASDQLDREGARDMLHRMAVDMVSSNGSVRSGYLRLTAGQDASMKLGTRWSRSADTQTQDAVAYVRSLVTKAYGQHSAINQALDAYLQEKGQRLGTHSFVKLVRNLENTEKIHAPDDALAGARIKSGAKLRTTDMMLQLRREHEEAKNQHIEAKQAAAQKAQEAERQAEIRAHDAARNDKLRSGALRNLSAGHLDRAVQYLRKMDTPMDAHALARLLLVDGPARGRASPALWFQVTSQLWPAQDANERKAQAAAFAAEAFAASPLAPGGATQSVETVLTFVQLYHAQFGQETAAMTEALRHALGSQPASTARDLLVAALHTFEGEPTAQASQVETEVRHIANTMGKGMTPPSQLPISAKVPEHLSGAAELAAANKDAPLMGLRADTAHIEKAQGIFMSIPLRRGESVPPGASLRHCVIDFAHPIDFSDRDLQGSVLIYKPSATWSQGGFDYNMKPARFKGTQLDGASIRIDYKDLDARLKNKMRDHGPKAAMAHLWSMMRFEPTRYSAGDESILAMIASIDDRHADMKLALTHQALGFIQMHTTVDQLKWSDFGKDLKRFLRSSPIYRADPMIEEFISKELRL